MYIKRHYCIPYYYDLKHDTMINILENNKVVLAYVKLIIWVIDKNSSHISLFLPNLLQYTNKMSIATNYL